MSVGSVSKVHWSDKIFAVLDGVVMLTLALVVPCYLDAAIKIWSYFIVPFSQLLLYLGLISNMSYLNYHAQWVKENAHYKLSSWLYSGRMLDNVTDKPTLVISAYKEDLTWVKRYLPYTGHVYLYCKDKAYCAKGLKDSIAAQPGRFTVQVLPNIGRESHTYLTHILANYDRLPARTVFTLGSLNISWLRELSLRYALADVGKMRSCYKFDKGPLQDLYNYEVTVDKPPVSLGEGYDVFAARHIQPAQVRPLGKWLEYFLQVDLREQRYRCGWGKHGAIFSADKAMLLKYKKSQYAKLLAENSVGDSLEAGYYLEVSWRFLLGQQQ